MAYSIRWHHCQAEQLTSNVFANGFKWPADKDAKPARMRETSACAIRDGNFRERRCSVSM